MEFTRTQTDDGDSTLRLRLDPPELGELVIRLEKSGVKLALRVEAIEPSTLDMLLARGSEIEDQLRRQGSFSSLDFSASLLTEGGTDGSGSQHARDADPHASPLSGSVRSARRSHISLRQNGLSFRA
jgi:hypothetical protein